MSDIFISYASEDLNRIKPVIRALEKTGWDIFSDRTIPPGGTWPKVIGAEVDSCRCMLVIWSKKSIHSEFVYEKAESAKQRGVLIPVLIDDVVAPFGFRGRQAAKLSDWDGKKTFVEFNSLLNALTGLLGNPPVKKEDMDIPVRSKYERQNKQPGIVLVYNTSVYPSALQLHEQPQQPKVTVLN